MNRRGLFAVLAGAVAAAVDPERLLWIPGRKLISIPKPATVFYFHNVGIPPELFAEIIRRQLTVHKQIARMVFMREEFQVPVGSTIAIRRPWRFQR